MTIKKRMQPLHDFLSENLQSVVQDIMPQIEKLMSASTPRAADREQAYISVDGACVAIKCGYFQRWMPLVGDAKVDFAPKSNTAHSYSLLSRIGQTNYSKQLSAYKKAEAKLIDDLQAGKVAIDQIAEIREANRKAKEAVEETTLGFGTREECVDYLKTELGIEIE